MVESEYYGNSLIHDIFQDNKELWLPVQWDGKNFYDSLKKHFEFYINHIKEASTSNQLSEDEIHQIKEICTKILRVVDSYLQGLPSKSYDQLRNIMQDYKRYDSPFLMLEKSVIDAFETKQSDSLVLFRVRHVDKHNNLTREDLFHVPFNMRAKVSANRYSIAGYPCLYLSTSLNLCCYEVGEKQDAQCTVASAFRLDRSLVNSKVNIQVIDLALRPQDLLSNCTEQNDNNLLIRNAHFLAMANTQKKYLRWYPLIAASSYIRDDKGKAFAEEYIVPQVLMQWVRKQMITTKGENREIRKLMGVRYFSSSSKESSALGVNYVFPTSGKPVSNDKPFCQVLNDSFFSTNPVCINNYESIQECEKSLKAGNQEFIRIIDI